MLSQSEKKIPTALALIIIVVLVILVSGGILGYQYWQFPEEEVQPLVIETLKDGTANWKTYRNEEYGFEVKYPPHWGFEEKEWPEWGRLRVIFHSPEPGESGLWWTNWFTIHASKTSYDDFDEWFYNEYSDVSDESLAPEKKGIVVINDNEWVKVFNPVAPSPGEYLFIIKNSIVYSIPYEEIVPDYDFRFLE